MSVSSSEIHIPEIAVAAVDILGVKEFFKDPSRPASAVAMLKKFVMNACENRYFPVADIESQPVALLYAHHEYFGDSVYLFADSNAPLPQQVSLLAMRISTLIAVGLTGTNRFLVRCGIGVGDVTIFTVNTSGGPREVRIGSAMIRAHELEVAQRWIGAAIDPAAPLGDDLRRWLGESPPPLKENSDRWTQSHSINWIGAGCRESDLCQRLENSVRAIGMNDDAREKLENTKAFVNDVFKSGKFCPVEMEAIFAE